jgi:hypothetical protein
MSTAQKRIIVAVKPQKTTDTAAAAGIAIMIITGASGMSWFIMCAALCTQAVTLLLRDLRIFLE